MHCPDSTISNQEQGLWVDEADLPDDEALGCEDGLGRAATGWLYRNRARILLGGLIKHTGADKHLRAVGAAVEVNAVLCSRGDLLQVAGMLVCSLRSVENREILW